MRNDNCLTYDLHVKTVPSWTRWQELPKSYKEIEPWVEMQPPDVQERVKKFYDMGIQNLDMNVDM
jgi:hypothetical protein